MSSATLFRPHGNFSVYVHEQILLTEVTGPWNRELVDYWAEQAFVLAQQFSRERPYVAVTEVYESMLCPPDALERIGRAVAYTNQHLPSVGQCIVAAPSVEGRDLLKSLYEKIQFAQIFETREQALEWARHRLGLAP